MGIEPTSSAWKADILADVLYPQLQNALYHNFAQMSSMNLGSATVKVAAFLLWEAPAFCKYLCGIIDVSLECYSGIYSLQ